MTTWAIGDVHACLDDLERLLDRIAFDPAADRLWFVGDLVNRGPRSLDTLRFVRGLGDCAITILGNHDLHLLAAAVGVRAPRPKDNFDDVLNAPDRDELLDWLRWRQLLHTDDQLGFTMVHAGLHPHWDMLTAHSLARDIEAHLRRPGFADLLTWMYGDQPATWSPRLTGSERLRFAINAFTRMRYCQADGTLDFDESGPPGSQPDHLMPWFDHPDRPRGSTRLVFGHWSQLGCVHRNDVHGLDAGCVYGNALTALNLDDGETMVQIGCPGGRTPGKN